MDAFSGGFSPVTLYRLFTTTAKNHIINKTACAIRSWFLPAGTWSRRCAARRATFRRPWWPCCSGSGTLTRRWTRWSTRTSTATSGKRLRTRCSARSATCAGARRPTWRRWTRAARRSGTTTARAACTPRRTWTTATGGGPASSAAAYDPPRPPPSPPHPHHHPGPEYRRETDRRPPSRSSCPGDGSSPPVASSRTNRHVQPLKPR